MKNKYAKPLAIIAIFSILITGCKKSDDKLVHVIKDEYNIEDQREIGKSLKNLILNNPDRYPILSHRDYADFYEYINTLLNMLANTDQVVNRLAFNWDVTIIHDDNVATAFITPGGHLFIYTGLLKFISSENELFSILAHEINYADSQILMKRLVSDFGKDVIGDLLLGYDLPETRNIASRIRDLIFKESEVLVADRYALTIICPFQYDAFGLKTFIEAAHFSSLEIQWLVTRPSSITRIETIEEYAINCGVEEDTFAERYTEYKALLP
jgi:predicted Zn-dependent protease